MTLFCRQLEFDSPEYDASLRLREDVLRKPLGMKLRLQDQRGEQAQVHFGAFEDGKLVGVIIFVPEDKPNAKLRQMAIAPLMQGKGVGAKLLERVHAFAKAAGYPELTLNARETARSFYAKNGYAPFGAPFNEVGIPHVAMRITL
jgi:predicted GNAT family N-acyltransferase